MKRRDAIKSIGVSSGALVSSGAILSLLQSCMADKDEWKPLFLNTQEGKILSAVCDVIMPADEWPSASAVNVPQFIDLMYKDVFDPKEGEEFRKGLTLFNQAFEEKYGDSIDKADADNQAKGLGGFLSVSQDRENEIKRLVRGETGDRSSDEYLIYRFLTKTRDMTISAYFQSETIGEKYLAYNPFPGGWQGCVEKEEGGVLNSPDG